MFCSSGPTVPKAQQLPQAPWFRTGLQPCTLHQLKALGSTRGSPSASVGGSAVVALSSPVGVGIAAGSGTDVSSAAHTLARSIPSSCREIVRTGDVSVSHGRW